jgi:hypothetical protein
VEKRNITCLYGILTENRTGEASWPDRAPYLHLRAQPVGERHVAEAAAVHRGELHLREGVGFGLGGDSIGASFALS